MSFDNLVSETVKEARSIHIPRSLGRGEHELRRRLFSGEQETTASVLFVACGEMFDTLDFMQWESEVLHQEIKQELDVIMPTSVANQLNAMITALSTDLFYKDPIMFNYVCNALSGEPVNFEVFEPATIEELACGIIEVLAMDSDGNPPTFAPEVTTFISVVLKEQGLRPFGPFEFVPDNGVSEGFDMVEDADMVAYQAQERVATKSDVLDAVRERVRLTHAGLNALNVSSDKRSDKLKQV